MDLLKYRKKILPDYSKLAISVSGGRTSMLLARFIQTNPIFKGIQKKYIFANTGKEKEETLIFIDQCDKNWNLGIIWIEPDIRSKKGKGTSYYITDFEKAKRKGEPFNDLVLKYGIPNKHYLHCTRDLKIIPIKKAIKAIFGENVYSAIGIREDEKNRINRKHALKERYIYPFVDIFPINEKFVRSWWDSQNFDLQLKDYQGNCDFCWKKSLRKRLTLIKENPSIVQDWDRWEKESDYVFDRDGYTIPELIELSKLPFEAVKDKHHKKTGSKNLDVGASCLCG